MNKTFAETLNGTLWGLMRWEQWDGLRRQIGESLDPWYFYAVGEDLPAEPLAGERLAIALEALDALLRNDHRDEHLGIVYTDDFSRPSFVKIYDPHHMGGCGGGQGIPPGWTISRQPPEFIAHGPVRPENRRRWWRELQEKQGAGG
ncbi:MAG: hypothetical protein PHU46_15550 [Rhodocyclaceae bacterium]|nr:hypothetical protein [Rhodocyclaceae bacterium]